MENIIFHIDVNSAFLSWSAIKLLKEGQDVDIRQVPAIVGGDQSKRRGIVVAKSIPAKKYDIQTAETVASAFQKCPDLIMVSPDHAYYKQCSKRLFSFLRDICPVIEQASIDECYMSYEPLRKRFKDPLEAAYFIKDSVRDRFGFTVNIGISDKKVLAKMASDFTKPDRVHTLYTYEIKKKMWPLPVSELFMCGKSASKKLNDMGVKTIGELAALDENTVFSMLKSHGLMLLEYANGLDDSVVNPLPERVKGVGNSITLAEDLTQSNQAYRVLKDLAKSVAQRLKKNDFLAGSLCVEIKYSSFRSVSHQCQLSIETNDQMDLYRESCVLFDNLWDKSPIRLLGIRTGKLVDTESPRQMNIFQYQEDLKEHEKHKKLQEAMDAINSRYGQGAIKKGL